LGGPNDRFEKQEEKENWKEKSITDQQFKRNIEVLCNLIDL
jgi:hypothetical protein